MLTIQKQKNEFSGILEQRLRDTNANHVQASFDALVKPVQSTFDGSKNKTTKTQSSIDFYYRKLSVS